MNWLISEIDDQQSCIDFLQFPSIFMDFIGIRKPTPWTICPRQLAPNLQTTSPSFIYPLPSQTSH